MNLKNLDIFFQRKNDYYFNPWKKIKEPQKEPSTLYKPPKKSEANSPNKKMPLL